MTLDYSKARLSLIIALQHLTRHEGPRSPSEALHHLRRAYLHVRPGTKMDDTGEPFGDLQPKDPNQKRFEANCHSAGDRVQSALDEIDLLLKGKTDQAQRNELADLIVQAYELL